MSATSGAKSPHYNNGPTPLVPEQQQAAVHASNPAAAVQLPLSRAANTASTHPDAAAAANGYFNNYDQYQSQDHRQSINYTDNDEPNPVPAPVTSPTPRVPKFTEEWDASRRGSSIVDGPTSAMIQRSNSYAGSALADRPEGQNIARGNTLKKKPSLRRGASLRRTSSRRSMKAGSVRSLALQSNADDEDMESPFWCPVPTHGNPTEVLANRFQAWRKVLKDLITYFREIQSHYEHRSKSLLKLANVLNNTSMPAGFLPTGGLDDALDILRVYNKKAIAEANKARDIEEDVILALTGLRSDLHIKIKEIKNLAGDFKNTVEKETEATRRAVKQLNEILGQAEADPSSTTGKQDPYLLRLAVDRQVERQIEEENYLHRAYLNIEKSGRDLESIVVGEVQKAYNAYAGILKREADAAYSAVDELRAGPISMPKDNEWSSFVAKDDRFVDPRIPLRTADHIRYKGQDALACQEIRAGLLERKSKYLKSYTAGWYVLSPTHLHEFKSADKTQAPVMSLYLPEQKLGSHSTEGASSNKFIIKGRQTGSMHRGHTWVFRAESYDTMMAWYMDIKMLTEGPPEQHANFVRQHSRSYSRASQRSGSSDGINDDEGDDEPFAPDSAAIRRGTPTQDILPRRPSPGGRFPSDMTINAERGLQAPLSPASVNDGYFPGGPGHVDRNNSTLSRSSSRRHQETIAAAAGLPGSDMGQYNDPAIGYGSTARTPIHQAPSHAAVVSQDAKEDGINPYTGEPIIDGGRQDYQGVSRSSSVKDGSRRGSVILVANGNSVVRDGETGTAQSANTSSDLDGESVLSHGRSTTVVAGAVGSSVPANMRPISKTMRTDSDRTISNLHIPGGYPKSSRMAQ